jgi:CheY-like chemotaxis protein
VPAHLQFSIIDTGPGISPADQARLFHAFEQANDARPDSPGTGLGLAISRALVERLGGQLSLVSALGSGSTFSFALDLPIIQPAALSQTSGERIAGYEGQRRRVLVVDDHAINRRLLLDLLTPLGFDCADFTSPEVALARLTAGGEPWPDLAIVDVRMAGLDGLALTRALRALPRGPQLKVLLSSASVLSFNLADGRSAGADDFIAKPFLTSDLLEKIAQLLALTWRLADSAPPFSPSVPSSDSPPLPPAALSTLREHLAHGDLDALRAEVAALRASQPSDALTALDDAAARYDLARLRALLA